MRRDWRLRGFTLLELVVVLAIVSLALGLAAPAMSRWIEGSQARAWRGELRAYLNALPLEAHRSGHGATVDAKQLREAVPSVPADVNMTLDAPLIYADNGAATGGRLVMRRVGRADEIWLVAMTTGAVIPLSKDDR